MMTVVIYARVSTHEQSPELQLRELRSYCQRRGWSVTREYVDTGISGATDCRPELNILMADAHQRRFDIVLVWKFDRFARSVSHLLRALETFRSLGIEFCSYSEQLDTTTPAGKMVFTVLGAVAELERSLITERVRAGMGLHVAAVDLGPEKMALARKLGAEIAIDAKTQDPATEIQKQIGGAHGVLVTAVSTIAFKQAIGMLRRGGTCVLNGLPPGEFPVSIFDVVLNRYTIRGSIVGTRLDLQEALSFAAEGKVSATIETQPLASINDIFERLKTGKVNGRVVLAISEQALAERTTTAAA